MQDISGEKVTAVDVAVERVRRPAELFFPVSAHKAAESAACVLSQTETDSGGRNLACCLQLPVTRRHQKIRVKQGVLIYNVGYSG
jgi:hypothetical protein